MTLNIRPGTRVAVFLFRVSFLYWILWGIPWALQQFARLTHTPGMGVRYWLLWSTITAWVGEHILDFTDQAVYTDLGTGDSPFFWTLVVVHIAAACALAAAWTAFLPRFGDNAKLNTGLVVGLRFLFAFVLIEYGAAKVIPTQFPTPPLDALATPLGELPPHRLLWAFMGVSPLYNLLAGTVEMTAGALLLFRRTATLGAVLGIAAIANVLAFNLAYDVSVKLFSIHLLLMGAWLFAPAAPRVLQAVLPPVPSPAPSRPTSAAAISLVVLLLAAGLSLRENAQDRRTYGERAPRPPLYGRYRIADEGIAGSVLPPLWHFAELIIPAHRGPAQIRFPDGRVLRYRFAIDTLSKKVTVQPVGPAAGQNVALPDSFTFRHTDAGLDVSAFSGASLVTAHLAKVDSDTLPLLRQKFRWIH